MSMRFQFNAHEEYQLDAIRSVTDLFRGQPRDPEAILTSERGSSLISAPNTMALDEAYLLSSLQSIQHDNDIVPDDQLAKITDRIETSTGEREVSFPNFTVEMETGTGKTYVYLRTILELHNNFGLRKFIVVTPSVAIREGVLKTLRITRDHFNQFYDNPVYNFFTYSSDSPGQIRQFVLSDSIEIMIMTLDSFNKARNVIHHSNDLLQGEVPLYMIQQTRPILILDEPQNMESEKSVAALSTLNPLFALRYSATHRNPYNVVYRLTPAEAYRQGLVKKIEVNSVVSDTDTNRPYIKVEEIRAKKTQISARLRVHKLMRSGTVQEKAITIKPEDSLADKTGLELYQDYDIDEINPGYGFVRFSPANLELNEGEEHGADKHAIFRTQIYETITEHMRKQHRLKDEGIKVLSLFFIDRVDNYRDEDGIIRQLFYECFNDLKQKFPEWQELDPENVQAAYFASKRKQARPEDWIDSKTGESKEDRAVYDLIMHDKEALLSFPESGDDLETRKKKQVSFIFSHSALREGWDNPNVFQICTLNQAGSMVRKRQEVGRGIRLAVNQAGERVRDDQINILTVVANESYKKYVEDYQNDIAYEYRTAIEARYGKSLDDLSDEERSRVEEEYGKGILPPKPREAGKQQARLRKERVLSDEFKELWNRIKYKTRYSISLNTEQAISDIVPRLNDLSVSAPSVKVTKAHVSVDDDDLFEAMQLTGTRTALTLDRRGTTPNVIDLLLNFLRGTSPSVRLTRRSLLELFKQLNHDCQAQAMANPYRWATEAARIIKEELSDHLVNGIRYRRIVDEPHADTLVDSQKWYEMRQIQDEDAVELFSKYTEESTTNKSLYDLVPCDSETEREFVKQLEAHGDVSLYLKLPSWFRVPTPVGEYHPDWAIVFESEEQAKTLYLITETKSSLEKTDLRDRERWKNECGARHFGSSQMNREGALEGVDYRVVTSVDEIA